MGTEIDCMVGLGLLGYTTWRMGEQYVLTHYCNANILHSYNHIRRSSKYVAIADIDLNH
jgi:hypothetical protein